MKRISLIILTVVLTVTMFFGFAPTAKAQLYFGGRGIFALPCTCGGSGMYTLYFFPLYFSSVSMAGGLVVPYTPLLYSNYILRPGSWGLGQYTPGGICYMGVEPYCIYLPNYGLVSPMTGSSLGS